MSHKTPKTKGSNSPTKIRKANQDQYGYDGKDYVLLDKDLVRGVSEKEVEIEHLNTTVTALSEKVQVIYK